MVMEKVLVRLFTAEMGREPKKPLSADMLADNQFTRKIERRIHSRMNAIRDMGNLGPHGEAVRASDARRVLEDLCEVLDWYRQRLSPGTSPPDAADEGVGGAILPAAGDPAHAHGPSAVWRLQLYKGQQLAHTATLTGAVELGRERGPEDALYSHHPVSGGGRLVIAGKDEKSVSRRHALIEPLPGGGFRLTNLSGERPIGLPDGTALPTGASYSAAADAVLTIGKIVCRLQEVRNEPLPLHGLADTTTPPGQSSLAPAPFSGPPVTFGGEGKALVSWLNAAPPLAEPGAQLPAVPGGRRSPPPGARPVRCGTWFGLWFSAVRRATRSHRSRPAPARPAGRPTPGPVGIDPPGPRRASLRPPRTPPKHWRVCPNSPVWCIDWPGGRSAQNPGDCTRRRRMTSAALVLKKKALGGAGRPAVADGPHLGPEVGEGNGAQEDPAEALHAGRAKVVQHLAERLGLGRLVLAGEAVGQAPAAGPALAVRPPQRLHQGRRVVGVGRARRQRLVTGLGAHQSLSFELARTPEADARRLFAWRLSGRSQSRSCPCCRRA
jgi:hypothetical protein